MPWLRFHYHCEQCDGTWLDEVEVETAARIEAVADCRFCGAGDVFSYRSDAGRLGRAKLRTKLAVVEGARQAKTPARAGKLKRSA